MKFNQHIFVPVFSLVAFLVAAGVALLLMLRAADVADVETAWYRDRARKSVMKDLKGVVYVQQGDWRRRLEEFRRVYGGDIAATFTVGKTNGPVWCSSSLPDSAHAALRESLVNLLDSVKIDDDGNSVHNDVEPVEVGGHHYQLAWIKPRQQHWGRFGDVRVLGCLVEYRWNAVATQRLAALLVAGLMLVSLVAVWLLAFSARRTRREAALKTQFVANYAHELKTPLASLLLRAEMLKEGRYVSEEKRVRALEVIVSEGRRLNGMVLNLLDLIRIECRQISFARESFDLSEAVRSVGETMRPFFAAHGLEVRLGPPLPVRADVVRTREVLENLLSNAMKYAAASGPVSVDAACEDGWAVVRVRDRGPGLTPDQMKYAFDEYWRAEDGLTRETSGSGIGLFISREYARGMGGRLSVEAREGGGCAFVFALPLDAKGEEAENV